MQDAISHVPLTKYFINSDQFMATEELDTADGIFSTKVRVNEWILKRE